MVYLLVSLNHFLFYLTMFYSFSVYLSPSLLGLFLVCFCFLWSNFKWDFFFNSLSDTLLLKKCNIFPYMTLISNTHICTYIHTLIILIKLFTASYEQSFIIYINVNVFDNIIIYKVNPLLDRYIEHYDTIIWNIRLGFKFRVALERKI